MLEPLRLDEVRQWLKKADEDLRLAEVAHKAGMYGPATFHWQQAAEKALKAFPIARERGFRKTHNLEEIGTACAQLEPSLRQIAEEAATLTTYAWEFRYPGSPREIEEQEAVQALRRASLVFHEILRRLPPEASP